MRSNRPNWIQSLAAALLGGAWGGTVVGAGEIWLILSTSSPDERGLIAFGVISYALVGAALAALPALAVALARPVETRVGTAFGTGLAVSVAGLGIVVARYHVIQRVFREDLVLFSSTGLAVHTGLVVAGLVVGGLLWMLTARGVDRPAAILGSAVLLGGVVLVAVAMTRAGVPHLEAVQARATADPAKHRNVVLIVADTLRADSAWRRIQAGIGGMNRLATEGTWFGQTHSHSSWTRPSIATLLTSQYPSEHGAIEKMDVLAEDETTIAEVFRDAGYWTAGFVTNINVAPIFNFQQGFGEYHYLAPSFYFGATDSATRLAIYKGLRVARERLFKNQIYVANYYQDAASLTAAVDRWLASKPPEPYFLLIHFMDPHDPYFEIPYNGVGVARVSQPNPPATEVDRLRALYESNVDYLDAFLGRLLTRLEASGVYDRSVIALASDHGEEFQEHGSWWHGTSLYEEQIHVPLLIKRAGEVDVRGHVDAATGVVDVAPTLVAAAGLSVPESFHGRDLFQPHDESAWYAEETLEGNELAALRVGPWKLITANVGNPRGLAETELYNLASDPAERDNRADAEPDRVSSMLDQLDQLRIGSEDE